MAQKEEKGFQGCRRFSRWTQIIARSASFLSARPYKVAFAEKPAGELSRIS